MFEFLSFAIALAGLIFARKAFNEIERLRMRLDSMEAAASAAPSAGAAPQARREPELSVGTLFGEPVAAKIAVKPAAPLQPTPSPSIPAVLPLPPKLDQQGAGFEERLGTRWVVWIGGLTLALGGFFMVRYSIEAGLLGPGVRTLLGGVFALALISAGEWTRRKESVLPIASLPTANIPAILTAAGTAVAFATIYAAYALYGFLVPATAFVLLGMVALGTLAAALLHGRALAGLGIAAAFLTPVLVSSDTPNLWALYIYLAVVTAAALGLARIRLCAALRSPRSCGACGGARWRGGGPLPGGSRASRRSRSALATRLFARCHGLLLRKLHGRAVGRQADSVL